jgi:hypothetical protein
MNPDLGWQPEISEEAEQSLPHHIAEQLEDHQQLLDGLLVLSGSLRDAQNVRDCLESTLTLTRKMLRSDAGSIYLIDRTTPVHTVCFEVSQNDSQPNRSLVNFAVPLNKDSIVGYVALTGKNINLADVHDLPDDAEYRHHKTFDYDIDYYTRSVVAVPIFSFQNQTIGVFQLINRKDQDISITSDNAHAVTKPFSTLDMRVLQAITCQLSLYIDRSQLLGQAFKS